MVSMTATMDGAASAAFNEALKILGDSLGEASSQAPRRAAIQMCTNFATATKVADEFKGVQFFKSAEKPQWITYKDGRKLDRPLRRWAVVMTDPGRKNRFTRYVYATSESDMIAQLRKQVGTNYFPLGYSKGWLSKGPQRKGGARGLAKRSWGWVSYNIYHGKKPDAPWERRKNDRRNPKDATRESMSSESRGVTMSGGIARICNRLDYIGEVLKISVDEVTRKAASAIIRTLTSQRLRKSGGMSSREIRQAAKQVAEDFKRQFPD